VHQKNAAALALTAVKNEDQREFAKLADSFKSQFNEGTRVQVGAWLGARCVQQSSLPACRALCADRRLPVLFTLCHHTCQTPQWGGGIMGMKSQHKQKQKERILAKELAQRMTV
jgi:large subunit ribosomal protein L7Ae